MAPDLRAQALAHVRLLAASPGYWELRALHRVDGSRMDARGSFFIIAVAAGDTLIYDRLEQAVDWARQHDRNGTEIFIGVNPRAREGRGKADVETITACFADLDLAEGEDQDAVLEQITDGDVPVPSVVVSSGYGLHAVWLLREPTSTKALWRRVQRGLARKFSDLGADPKVATDESRILRLVPFANRKKAPAGVPTSILYQSESRYSLDELTTAFPVATGTTFSPRETLTIVPDAVPDDAGDAEGPSFPTTPGELERHVARAEGSRAILDGWIQRNFKPGLHFGVFPVDGKDASKPSLLKPGCEMLAQLFGWRFHFTADLDSLGMYSPTPTGTFAYRCAVIDSAGHTVGEGRGAAQLQEPSMLNPNKAIKMALKRAQTDAVLRCASLSEYFTQDLDDPQYVAPEAAATAAPAAPMGSASDPSHNGHKNGQVRVLGHHVSDRAQPHQIGAIRTWLQRTRRSEADILSHYQIERLEDLSLGLADRVLRRLVDIGRG